ncbi:MAG: tetratricopeptide repeat protein, partial [Mariprofundales bacterium]|nr:tetratricopeptide repeat protein [Mariprofundales bacterium]
NLTKRAMGTRLKLSKNVTIMVARKAMIWFGQMLEQGRGVSEDATEAFEWYKRAANLGDANGQYNLALCYQFGKGVDKDDNQAFTWYQKASDQQHVEALYNLGWLYSQGRGVDQNRERAKELFDIAASHNGASDELIIEAMDYDQGKGGVSKDPVRSHQLYLQAAEKGSLTAMFTVAVNYEYGRGVERDWHEASRWYKLAANKGHPEASFRYRFRHLTVDGTVIRFFRHSGVVTLGGVGVESAGVSSGVIGQFGRGHGVKKPRRKIKERRFYLDSDLGERVEVELDRKPDSLYVNQQVTLIYAIKKGHNTGPYMLLVNHQSNESQTITTSRTFWDEQVSGSSYLIGGGLLIVTVVLPFVAGAMLQSDGGDAKDTMAFILHPFNWLIFIPLALTFAFWIKFVLSQRRAGIEALRHHMAAIKRWIAQQAKVTQ